MRSLLVTGSDTGVGKTRVVAVLARVLARRGERVQIVKVVETGRSSGEDGDAERARAFAAEDSATIDAYTLASFPEPISPASAAARVGQPISIAALVSAAQALPDCDWRIYEGAGGIATPLDESAHDWADFAAAVEVDAVVVVVPDRLGAINQARLAYARAVAAERRAGIWLNAAVPCDAVVAASTREGLNSAGIPIWGELAFEMIEVPDAARIFGHLTGTVGNEPGDERAAGTGQPGSAHPKSVLERCSAVLAERDRKQLRRSLRVTSPTTQTLNLADNDYLDLARDSAVVSAVVTAAARHGTSASASPLITGWREPHAALVARLGTWHGFPCGLLWSSGYAANAAVLSGLPASGDLVFADRLIHHSMIAGLLRSGARLQRYEHLALDRLERLLRDGSRTDRNVFVVTESVFSMDGDYPDLRRMAELKRRYGFFWIVDEAHGVGWYGPNGAGLIRGCGVEADVDVLVGTFGKALASGGAYTLFRDEAVRGFLVNTAGEFIYSTSLPPTTVAAAAAAVERISALSTEQAQWHAFSAAFRARLRTEGWQAPEGDSPIVPVQLDEPAAAVELGQELFDAGIITAAIRPPTVPAGTSRLRLSLKRTLSLGDIERLLGAMNRWRKRR